MSSAPHLPLACIDNVWIANGGGDARRTLERRMPADWRRVLATVPLATPGDIALACAAASRASGEWRKAPLSRRHTILDAWSCRVEHYGEELARLLAVEIGKPIRTARGEVRFAAALISATATRFCGAGGDREERTADNVRIRRRPHGVVAIITPWNNPIAIPAGKLAPAIALGNSVVWKPAVEAPRTAIRLLELLIECGLPPGVVNLLFGDAEVGEALIRDGDVRAVSLTGSTATGRLAAAHCTARGIPLQGELGGNNAAVVLPDFDFERAMPALVQGAFAFAGQRCTALRRWIVHREILPEFTRRFAESTRALVLGDPLHEATELGPLVSRAHRDRITATVRRAVDEGATLLCGGDAAGLPEHGCWLRPALLADVAPAFAIAREETFGPLAMVIPAADAEHALELANGGEHGLVCAIFTHDHAHLRLFEERAEAGILQSLPGPLPVSPDAPFGGWRASGIGAAEHGEWDGHFYSRPQAVYAPAAHPQHATTLPTGRTEPFSANLSNVS